MQSETVPAHLVERLDRIFSDVPGVDTVELGALLMELTGNSGLPNWQPFASHVNGTRDWDELDEFEALQVSACHPTMRDEDKAKLYWKICP